MLVPLSDLENELPIRRFDRVETDEGGNSTDVRATFLNSGCCRKCGLGAKSDTHQIFKCSDLSFINGDVQAFLDLGYTLMSQKEASDWAGALPRPGES